MSSSSMRYSKEFLPYHLSTSELGSLRYVPVTTAKSWEGYGIHALEAMYPIIGPGFISVTNTGTKDRNVVHITHENEIDVSVIAIDEMYGGFGFLQLCGVDDSVQLKSRDSFYAFKKQFNQFHNTDLPPDHHNMSFH